MRIAYGTEIRARDGEVLGSVDGLVVAADTRLVRQVLLGSGLFHDQQRLVEVSGLSAEGDGLRLDLTRDQAEALPQYVRVERALPGRALEEPLFMPASGVGGPVIVDDVGPASDYPDNEGLIDVAPIDPPPVEVQSNLLETEVVLHKGADVVSADGHKVGDLAAVETGDRGTVERLTVRSGFIFTDDREIDGAAVREFDDDRVVLTAGRDELG